MRLCDDVTANHGLKTRRPLRVLLLTPPMIQLNTPYPGRPRTSPVSCGTRRAWTSRSPRPIRPSSSCASSRAPVSRRSCASCGLGSRQNEGEGRSRWPRRWLRQRNTSASRRAPAQAMPPSIAHFLAHARRLRGDGRRRRCASSRAAIPALALRIAGREFLPEGPRFAPLGQPRPAPGDDPLAWAFGALGAQDRAQVPREPLHRRPRRRRPRRHRPALRAVALRRAARRERADVRSAAAGARRRADAGRQRARRRSRASSSRSTSPTSSA